MKPPRQGRAVTGEEKTRLGRMDNLTAPREAKSLDANEWKGGRSRVPVPMDQISFEQLPQCS